MAAPAPGIQPERGGLILSLPVTAPISKVVIAFLLASQRHRRDIHEILERMK